MEGDYTKALKPVLDALNIVLEEDTSEYTSNEEFFPVSAVYSWIFKIRRALFEPTTDDISEMVGAYRPKRDLPEVVIIPLYDDISIIVDGTTTYMFGIRKGDRVILFPGIESSTTKIEPKIIELAKTKLIESGVPEGNIRENRNIDLAYHKTDCIISKFDIKLKIFDLLNLPSSLVRIENEDIQKNLHCFVALTFESARNDLVLAHMLSRYAAGLVINIDAITAIGKKWSNGLKYGDDTVVELVPRYEALGMLSISSLTSIDSKEGKAAKFHEITGVQVRCIRECFHMINMVRSELLYLEPFSIGLSRGLTFIMPQFISENRSRRNSRNKVAFTPNSFAMERSRGLTSIVRGGVFSLGDSASVLGRVFVDMANVRTERRGSVLNFPAELSQGLLSMVGKGIEPFVGRVSERLGDLVINREENHMAFDNELIGSAVHRRRDPGGFTKTLISMIREGRFNPNSGLASRLGIVLVTDILSDIGFQVLSVPVATNLGLILVNIIRSEGFNPEPFAIELSGGLVEIVGSQDFNPDIFAPELSRMLVEMVKNGFDPRLLTDDSTLGSMLETLDPTESGMLEAVREVEPRLFEEKFAVILSGIANRSAINPELFRIKPLQKMLSSLEDVPLK